jgi:sugar phosphate isomerase/epimerase
VLREGAYNAAGSFDVSQGPPVAGEILMKSRRRNTDSRNSVINRREFFAATGGTLLAATVPAATKAGSPADGSGSISSSTEAGQGQTAKPALRKIPIGVFDPVYAKLSLDEMLDKVSALGMEAMEIGAGGYSGAHHCPVDDLLADPAKAKAWQKKFEDRGIRVGALSCHGNALSPDTKLAVQHAADFRKTVLLAERLGVRVIVGFSGCPGGTPSDTQPNWITYRWPTERGQMLDWQWKEKVIPFWNDEVKFARDHGIHKIAFEMHPNFVVYNPRTLMKLRSAVGDEIGANCDLSHLFWQGCDPVAVIQFLGKQGALYHAHMKDTVLFADNVAKYGVLNFAADASDIPEASEIFRAVGYGHGADLWKSIVKAYMDVGYEGMLSIENEDPILSGEVGVERAAYVLKNVRSELLGA